MKATIENSAEEPFVDNTFVGLATDFEDEICMLTDNYIVYFGATGEDAYVVPKSERFNAYGPFTVFNGSLTLEN